MAKKNKAIKQTQKSVESDIYVGKPRQHNARTAKLVNHFAKKAASNRVAGCYPTGGGGSNLGAFSADTTNSYPSFYDPYFEPSTLVLPRDLLEINSWCRYFYKYDPYVATAIDMHAELPLSKMRLQTPKCRDRKRAQVILEHFEEMIGNDGIDLYNKLLQIGVEYYKLGNVFPFLQLDESETKWEKLTLLDPDYIRIEK